MIVTSCEACHLRFEAVEAEPPVRLCPACAEAGVSLEARTGPDGSTTCRVRVDPPALAPSLSDIGAPVAAREPIGARKPLAAREPFAAREPVPGRFEAEEPEDWTPIEPVFVDFEPSEPAREGIGARGAGLAGVVALVMAVGVGLTLREPIERFAPATAPMYQSVAAWTGIGTPVDGFTTASTSAAIADAKTPPAFGTRGLAIRNLETQIRQTDRGERLVVRGEVHNTGDPAALPPLQVTIRDSKGQPRYRWTVAVGAPGKTLASGATRTFTARSESVPADATSVRVDFEGR